ncbi:MAG: hypothetical protein JWO78_2503 [Micavibrio sp.]|nr:hypothetical protein [Micavibrio sp.]
MISLIVFSLAVIPGCCLGVLLTLVYSGGGDNIQP